MKSKKLFFNFDEDDESNASENSSFNNMNEDKNQTDSAKNSQKKENAMTKIVDEESTKSNSKND